MNDFVRRMAEIRRKKTSAPKAEAQPPVLEGWTGRPVFDPGGKRIGHVSHVRLDGTGGAWLEVSTDWGILDWLTGMGAGHPHFTFHSNDMEPRGEHDLVLKKSIGEGHTEAA